MKHFVKCNFGILIIQFLLLPQCSSAQQTSSQPDPFDVYLNMKIPNDTSNMKGKRLYKPFVRVFLPTKEKATGQGIVICPGGGYGMVALSHEGFPWGKYLAEQGIAVVVLKYRLPYGNYKIPVSDAEAAIQLMKDSAKVWNVNPNDVGIMGFSAGGHLASTIATHSQGALKPKFQILFYPVITMDKSYTHMGSHDNFLGKDASKKMEDVYSNDKQITKESPPAFIALAANDTVVVPQNSLNYFQALIKYMVPASMHIYPTGGHGFGFSEQYKFHQETLNELTLWLNEIK